MDKAQKQALLLKAREFFLERIAKAHLRNTLKLEDLGEFNVNPLTERYLARFFTGKADAKSLALSLILPRVLGTSISTTFGYQMQRFCGEVLQAGLGSVVPGIDIEFEDALDGRKKYCQIKSGPNTINADDIVTIRDKFRSVMRLARTNSLTGLQTTDMCVGVLYGTPAELSSMYRSLTQDHHIPVFVGQEFWYRLTGEEDFYTDLAQAFSDSAEAIDSTKVIDEVAESLALKIEARDKIAGKTNSG